MKSSEQAYDDLTAITGIGPARQRWFRESLNVRTYQDLAALSAAEIGSRLKADGQIAAPDSIEAWLLQARDLAASAGPSSMTNSEAIGEQEVAHKANSPVREDGWKVLGSFVVEFQSRESEGETPERRTVAHHMEADTGMHWPQIAGTGVAQWMVEQIRDIVDLEPEEGEAAEADLAESPDAKKPPAQISIGVIRVFQPPDGEASPQSIEAGKPFTGSLVSAQPFALAIDFELAGTGDLAKAKEQIEYSARAYAYDEATGTQISLGETGPHPLDPDEQTHTLTLPESTLPEGTFRLWVLVSSDDCSVVLPNYVEVAALAVT